ncbi:MAG: SpoIIE family protein phosphatase [Balneolaceae bacterium]|jgi:serine phosphatase RsbU (regulator of sigma subunit)
MEPQIQSKSEDLALRKILEGTASHTGKDFFSALVRALAEALNTKGAWVTEILPEQGKVRALSFWLEDHFLDEYEFDIVGTPCERVFREKQLFHIPENVIELFPGDSILESVNAVSYLGAPLLDPEGTILGNLAVLDIRPMPEEARNVTLFKIFADRAATELRRLNAENKLRERTEELQKEYHRKSEELEDARLMQLNMLPQGLPLCPGYQFSFSMKTAFEVGGDYYDYQMTDDNVLTFGIGDATGHGLQASVMVTAIKLLFSEHAAESDIVEFLKRASYSISLMDFQKIYMAFAIGRLSGQTLELAGAGMPPALIYRAKSNSLEQVQLKGLPLGSKTFFPYTKIITQIEPNDVVILMTDGLPELFNDDGEMLGYERVSELVLRVAVRSPEEIINYLHEACSSWLNGSNQDDDMTLFVFKRKNSGRPEFNI